MSSNSTGASLAILGLFLALAFIVPGIVYLSFLYMYFPIVRVELSSNPEFSTFNSALGLTIIAIVLGLLITAICFLH